MRYVLKSQALVMLCPRTGERCEANGCMFWPWAEDEWNDNPELIIKDGLGMCGELLETMIGGTQLCQ